MGVRVDRRRVSSVQSAAGARLGLVVLVIAATLVSLPTNAAMAAPNPPAAQTCGADLVLVLDASSSIRGLGGAKDRNGAADDVVVAADAFLDSIVNTGARVAIVSYDAKAVVQTDFAPVTAASRADGGAHAVALGDPGGPTGPVPASATGYSGHVRDGQGTNWDAALAEAGRLIERARAGGAAAVVHITDGDPTWHVRSDGSPTGMGTPEEHLRHAVVQADAIRAAGAHVYAVGVGPAADNLDALVATSGPDVYDQSDLADILDPVTDDVLLVTDPKRLVDGLRHFARAACGAALTVRVVTAESADGPFSPSEDWVVSATPGSIRGYDWVLPDTRPATSKTAATADGGEARFAWAVIDGDTWTTGVTVDAPVRDGYEVLDGTCQREAGDRWAVTWGEESFDVDLGVADAVTCELRAVAGGGPTDLDVSLTAVAGADATCPGSDDLLVAADHPVTYCATIANPSGRTVRSLAVTVKGIAWEPDVPTELAPGETVTVSTTVRAGVDAAVVLSATGLATASVRVAASDPTGVTVVRPGLVLEKTVDQQTVAPGTTVTYELVVRNDGTEPLGEVEVDDPDCGAITGPARADDDGDDHLEPGEVWTYTCTAKITEGVVNVARASAWAVDGEGERIPGGGLQARATATVVVKADVAGTTQTATGAGGSTRTMPIPRTGVEILGTMAGAVGLVWLGLLLVTARRRRE